MLLFVSLIYKGILYSQRVYMGDFEIDGILRTLQQYEIKENASTSTPNAGFVSIWAPSDGTLMFENEGGTRFDLTATGAGGGGGDGQWKLSGSTVYPTDTSYEVAIGTSNTLNSASLTVDSGADQVQVTIQADDVQSDSVVIVENSAGTEMVNIESDGTILTAVGLDAIGNVDMDYGSVDVDDHTFITDGTGDSEIVLPNSSISGTEILDDSVDSADYAVGSVDLEHMSSQSVDSDNIVNTTIVDADMANDALDPDKLVGDASDDNTIAHEIGGLEADVNAYTGVLAISGGSTSEVDSKSELESQIVDVDNFAEADGDTWTGDHNAGGANSFEIPNAADPAVNATGEIAVDTETDNQPPMLTFYGTDTARLVIAIESGQLPAVDNEIIKYDLATGEFVLEADADSGGQWTDTSNTIHPTTIADLTALGSDTALSAAQFSVVGRANIPQAIFRANSAQTGKVLTIEGSTGTDTMTVAADGSVVGKSFSTTGITDDGDHYLNVSNTSGYGTSGGESDGDLNYDDTQNRYEVYDDDDSDWANYIVTDELLLSNSFSAVAGAWNFSGGTLEIPNSAGPTVDAFGEIAGSSTAWATGKGSAVFYDGGAVTYLIGVLGTDTPSDGQVPQWNTGGNITWEAAGGAETNSLETKTTGIATTEIPIGTAADTVVYAALSGDATMANDGTVTVVDDLHAHVITNIDSFTKANLETQLSDVSDVAEADGDIYTGAHDFGGANDFEIPNGTSTAVDTLGQIAVDSEVDNMAPVMLYYGTDTARMLIGIDVADVPADNDVIKYNLATGEFAFEADAGAAGGDDVAVDGDAGVTNPDFVSTGDIDFVDTTNVVTANINAASIDGDNVNSNIAGRSITLTAATPDTLDADPETYIYKGKIAFENPVAGDDFFFDELQEAVTFTSIYAKTLVGTVDFDITIAGSDINGTDITATTGGVLDSSFAGATTGAVGEEVKLEITSVASSPTYIMIIVTGTYDD